MTYEFVTIEFARGFWTAILWDKALTKIATGAGASPQAALKNAVASRDRRAA